MLNATIKLYNIIIITYNTLINTIINTMINTIINKNTIIDVLNATIILGHPTHHHWRIH